VLRGRLASWIAVFALLGLALLTTFLAASLDRVTFSEGTPFDEHDLVSDRAFAGARSGQEPMRWLDYLMAYGPLGVLGLGFLVYVMLRGNRWTKQKPRTNWRMLVSLVLVMTALAIVARQQIVQSLQEALEDAGQDASEITQASEAAPVRSSPVESQPSPPGEGRVTSTMLQIALALVLLGAGAALAVAAIRWRSKTPRPAPAPPDFTPAVDTALEELRWGRDAAGVVERCYRDMLKAYARASGIEPAALTPREFAQALAAMGYGKAAIDELTSLFELVHYGGRPDDGFSPRAMRCMVDLRTSLPTLSQAEA
jgi:hypothetical protein